MCWRALFSKSINPACEFIEASCIVHTRTTNTETGYNTHRHRTILLLALLYNPDGYSLSYRFPRRLKNNLTIESIGRYRERATKGMLERAESVVWTSHKIFGFLCHQNPSVSTGQALYYFVTTLYTYTFHPPSWSGGVSSSLLTPPSDTPLHVLWIYIAVWFIENVYYIPRYA